jgi:hypothetical protein
MGMRMGIRSCSRVVRGETFSELKQLGVGPSGGRGARDGDAAFREFDRSAHKWEALIVIPGRTVYCFERKAFIGLGLVFYRFIAHCLIGWSIRYLTYSLPVSLY